MTIKANTSHYEIVRRLTEEEAEQFGTDIRDFGGDRISTNTSSYYYKLGQVYGTDGLFVLYNSKDTGKVFIEGVRVEIVPRTKVYAWIEEE